MGIEHGIEPSFLEGGPFDIGAGIEQAPNNVQTDEDSRAEQIARALSHPEVHGVITAPSTVFKGGYSVIGSTVVPTVVDGVSKLITPSGLVDRPSRFNR